MAYGVLDYYGQPSQAGQLSEEAAKAAAAAAVKVMRYERNDYFWINDFQPRVIMHPVNAALVGQDVSTFADPNGKLIYMEAVATREAGRRRPHGVHVAEAGRDRAEAEAVVREAVPALELGHRLRHSRRRRAQQSCGASSRHSSAWRCW